VSAGEWNRRAGHAVLAAVNASLAASPAVAAEDRFEFWLSPTVTVALDERSYVELETAQRFRQAAADDTYWARLWVGREVAEDVTVGIAVERRHEGDGRETRFSQQVAYPLGPLSGRTRLEQRLIEGDPATGWRLRQRVGGALPLSSREGGWKLAANLEGFFTLAPSTPGAQTGLTGFRSFIGVERAFGKIEVSMGYVRNQAVRRDAPDTVAHAPLIGLGLAF
jgi:hypothetical protein